MSRPSLFPNFQTNPPSSSVSVLKPFDEEPQEDPETKEALSALAKQIFKEQTISRDMIYLTKFIILLRPLEFFPLENGQHSIYAYNWFAGHYDWNSLLVKTLEIQENSTSQQALFLIPTLGQSLQGSRRHDLTYNAFIAPQNLPPFTQLCERKAAAVEPEKEEDLDLDKKSDPIKYKNLAEFGLEWKEVFTFDNNVSQDLGDLSFKLFLLSPTPKIITDYKRMPQTEFESWYDTVMGNFLPSIPHPTVGENKLTTLPLVIVDPIECTPPCYIKLLNTINHINEVIGGEERAIINTVKYWQYAPVQIAEVLPLFINNNNAIPEKNREFNQLFADQFTVAREFIVDEVFDNFLGIKRKLVAIDPNDPDERDIAEEPATWKGAQAEIDWELDFFDAKAKKLYGNRPEVIEALSELKEQIPFWFDSQQLVAIYGEFKATITESLINMIKSDSFSTYLGISKEENSNPERNEWLKAYYENKVSFSMWPTIYKLTGPVEGEPNELLVQTEQNLLQSAHVSIPGIVGKVLPPKD